MSENKHTPEPWHLCEVENETGRIKHLVPVDAEKMSLLTIVENDQATFAAIYNDDDARRIVACVNACAGCATEVLETAPVGFFNSTYGHPKYLEEITKQRDELLAALERFMDSHEECTDFDGFTAQIVSMADYHQAQEAIASVKEK